MEPEKSALEQLAYNDDILDPEAEAPPREEDTHALSVRRAKSARRPVSDEDAAPDDE